MPDAYSSFINADSAGGRHEPKLTNTIDRTALLPLRRVLTANTHRSTTLHEHSLLSSAINHSEEDSSEAVNHTPILALRTM